ncbi:hypothetical protein GGTG_07825 [Gaeumannomyces tritici R3-111a-1]|uniref:NACHT domain-containing protein n=1 Tax=Gaeumannomyces tritici (strain R3-111a-1) TaxID=644352 RepID=J3P2T3_GAET3|nr:hypothetical protein GGTG_07825 [Gaeumannomyces tritici R3-111a-1]EJT73975.1 hypothetical protein GGTG_07825 [Gaeumannomyces tritici R3-111a-1]
MSDSIPNTEYTIGWIAALSTELLAASQFLDKRHNKPTSRHPNDTNNYTLGSIGPHNVVMACLPMGNIGTASAAVVATNLINSFPNVRLGLMVGIGGGAPRLPNHDIRLGDVVVSSPGNGNGGVLQYDFGKTVQEKEFQLTGSLNQPPLTLLAALSGLQVQHEEYGHQFQEKLNQILEGNPRLRRKYSRPSRESDRLYRSKYVHTDPEGLAPGSPEQPSYGESEKPCGEICGEDPSHLVPRVERGDDEDDPAIHYGLIASANRLMEDALVRDHLAKQGVLCFEMEAAGLMNTFPCLVIRGICDYSDSHKNYEWQGYAAMMAAAYAKDLLQHIIPSQVAAEKSIKEAVSELEQKVDSLHHATLSVHTKLEAGDVKARIKQMQDWLSPADASTNANRADKLHHPGTCTWLLEGRAFREVCSGSRRQLWLHALAGCGKTVLCAAVLEHLTDTAGDGRLILKFFFDFRDTKKQTLDAMLRSLVFQSYRWQLTSIGHCAATVPASGDQPTEKQLQETFCRMLVAQKEVFIILDALDESTTGKGMLLSWIKDMRVRTELQHVRLIFTSRPEPEFEQSMPNLIGKENCVPLDKRKVNADIRSYIAAKLTGPTDFVIGRIPEHLVDSITREVGDRADGMFRWAECQLEELAECVSLQAIKDALRNLPKAGDLKETYDRMMAKIPNNIMGDATRLLQFLVHAEEPLTVTQAMEVIATQVDPPRCFDPERKPLDLPRLLKHCPGLIRMDGRALYHGSLSLAHFSVKEYLLERAGFTNVVASRSITWACLVHLPFSIRPRPKRWEANLGLYAWKYWMRHAARLLPSDLRDMAEDKGLVFAMNCRQSVVSGFNVKDSEWKWTVRQTWDFPLCVASSNGHIGLVQLLLNAGADVDGGGDDTEPLMAASERGHGAIVKVLLDNGAKINAWDQLHNTALTMASEKGHLGIVQQLLDAGAEVNPQVEGIRTALIMASRWGHLDVTQKLLDAGAKINAVDTEFGAALTTALQYGHLNVARHLLDQGAKVNVQGGTHGSPLIAAVANGHLDIARHLLDLGAKVDVQGGTYGSPLIAAAVNCHWDAVRLLLDKGADVNASCQKHGTALNVAAQKGDLEISRLLLDYGAGMMASQAGFAALLNSASKRDGAYMVQKILDNGVDVLLDNRAGANWGCALRLAVMYGYVEAVRMLLDAGADLYEHKGYYRPTFLDIAERKGFEQIAQLLRAKGVLRCSELKEAALPR